MSSLRVSGVAGSMHRRKKLPTTANGIYCPTLISWFHILFSHFHESRSIHENVRIMFQSGTTSLSSLTAIEACQRVYHWRVLLRPIEKSKCYVSTDKWIGWWHRGESRSDRLYKWPSYEVTLYLVWLCLHIFPMQRAEIAISLCRHVLSFYLHS